MAIGIFPNQDCIFISARIWIMVQMSFEYCSVVVSNTELYLFFASWEEFRRMCCLTETTESFCSCHISNFNLYK